MKEDQDLLDARPLLLDYATVCLFELASHLLLKFIEVCQLTLGRAAVIEEPAQVLRQEEHVVIEGLLDPLLWIAATFLYGEEFVFHPLVLASLVLDRPCTLIQHEGEAEVGEDEVP